MTEDLMLSFLIVICLTIFLCVVVVSGAYVIGKTVGAKEQGTKP